MLILRPVRHVDAYAVDTGSKQRLDHDGLARRRAESGKNLCSSHSSSTFFVFIKVRGKVGKSKEGGERTKAATMKDEGKAFKQS
jgi:hypothetical protein